MEARKRVAVTGANGFIGRYVVEYLARDQSVEVVAIARNATRENIAQNVLPVPVGEYQDFDNWNEVLNSVDSIVHTAGVVSATHLPEVDQHDYFMSVNRDITRDLARLCVSSGVRRFILLSSMSVYRSSPGGYLTKDSPLDLSDDYPASKRAAEIEVELAAQGSPMDWIAIRPPMVVGEGTSGTFYSLVRALSKIGVSPFGSLDSKYPIVTLDTLARFVHASIELDSIDGGIYLVGEPCEFSVREIIDLIAHEVGGRVRHIRIPRPALRIAHSLIGQRSSFDHLASDLRIDSNSARKLINRYYD